MQLVGGVYWGGVLGVNNVEIVCKTTVPKYERIRQVRTTKY